MRKGIEWLKEELDKSTTGFNGRELSRYEMGRLDGYTHASMLLDELDEPETLNEEWINEHSKSYTMENSVEISDLKNLLLPQPKKSVIPQFVADWIEKQMKFGYEDVFISMTRLRERALEKVKFWFRNNADTYARAWLDGYEVEKEKLYRVVFSYKGETVYLKEGVHGDFDVIETETYGTQYTEAEIKAIDERFWAFAEEVTE